MSTLLTEDQRVSLECKTMSKLHVQNPNQEAA